MKARYEPYNGSHILAPICEGVDAHVDLGLNGKYHFRVRSFFAYRFMDAQADHHSKLCIISR